MNQNAIAQQRNVAFRHIQQLAVFFIQMAAHIANRIIHAAMLDVTTNLRRNFAELGVPLLSQQRFA